MIQIDMLLTEEFLDDLEGMGELSSASSDNYIPTSRQDYYGNGNDEDIDADDLEYMNVSI